jgi:hypothetical protein
MKKLTRIEIKALAAVGDGADVFSPVMARMLRDLQKVEPAIVSIVRPLAPTDSAGVRPYFGAKLTAHGKALVEAAAAKGGAS